MNDFLLDKARQLKEEGYDYGKIRTYLSNAGHKPQEITTAFRYLDDEEIHHLYQRQQLAQLRVAIFIGLVPTMFGIGYIVYEYLTYGTLSVIPLIPIGFLSVVYYKYHRIRNLRFTAREIMNEEKKKVSWRNRN